MFTRPANEKSQHTRPANERSQYIRPVNERSQHIRPAREKSQHRITKTERIIPKSQQGNRKHKNVNNTRSKPAVSRHSDIFAGRHKGRNAIDRSSLHSSYDKSYTRRNRHHHHHKNGHHHHRFGHYPHRTYHRVIWPRYRYIVHYNWGPRWAFQYVYPYYHRRYIFVSLGGYWPIEYRYARYYWYGCHPYYWYGYYPVAYEVKGDTYNYYTYNYNYSETGEVADGVRPVDENTFADVREKLAAQSAEEPDEETLADECFEDAVKAFEEGDYELAADKFAEAIDLEPDDIILPFAYVQALFADEQYAKAVEVLREAVIELPPEKEGVFFPRGLYPDDDILFEQIGRLEGKADLYSLDADMQLLLGYQLLGAGRLDQAEEPLQRAGENLENAAAAETLLELLEKIKTESAEDAD